MIETLVHILTWLFFGLCTRFVRDPVPPLNDHMARWRKLARGLPSDDVASLLGPSEERTQNADGERWAYEHGAFVAFNPAGRLERWSEPLRW